MKSRGKESNPIVDEFYLLARHKWSRVGECTTLMRHPLVAHTAGDPSDEDQKAKALKKCLKGAIKHLKAKEKAGSLEPGRSVAEASSKLLRLAKADEHKSLVALRAEAADNWRSQRRDGAVSADSFRLHVERQKVFEPFAGEFLSFARRELKEHGVELTEDSEYLEPPRTMGERMARRLEELEGKWHAERLDVLGNDGSFKIKDEEEMLEVLLALNDLAEHGFLAVDYTPISKWSTNRQLKKYLRTQLKRIKESNGDIALERIRIVGDDELAENHKHLAKFVKAHEDASASLLLMPEEALKNLEVTFSSYNGLLLADPGVEPVAVTGRLGEGSVGRGLIYTRMGNEVRTLLDEYDSLKAAIEENDYDAELRKRLTAG